jgi:hypothetical protein
MKDYFSNLDIRVLGDGTKVVMLQKEDVSGLLGAALSDRTPCWVTNKVGDIKSYEATGGQSSFEMVYRNRLHNGHTWMNDI